MAFEAHRSIQVTRSVEQSLSRPGKTDNQTGVFRGKVRKTGQLSGIPNVRLATPRDVSQMQPGNPEYGHWDYKAGDGEPQRFLQDGTPVDHDNNPLSLEQQRQLALDAALAALAAAIAHYWWVAPLAF